MRQWEYFGAGLIQQQQRQESENGGELPVFRLCSLVVSPMQNNAKDTIKIIFYLSYIHTK